MKYRISSRRLYVFALFVAILFLAIGVIALVRNLAAVDRASKAYVDEAIVSIAEQWSSEELIRRASPGFRAAVNPDDLKRLFRTAQSDLGPLVEYEGSRGTVTIGAGTSTGAVVTATYVARAKFQNGTAAFRVTVSKVEGSWKIDSFDIASDLPPATDPASK